MSPETTIPVIRLARAADAERIVDLVRQLAISGDASAITAGFVRLALERPEMTLYVAERSGRVLGVMSLSERASLCHAASSCTIEELVVDEGARGQGIGSALVLRAIEHARARGSAELSVSTMPDNAAALRLYRRHGLTDEAVLLERHL